MTTEKYDTANIWVCAKGISIKEGAKRLGVSRQTMSKWVNEGHPRVVMLAILGLEAQEYTKMSKSLTSIADSVIKR